LSTGLTSQVTRGAAWLFGARVWSQFLQLTIGVLLARLLAPADYGLLAMVTVVTSFFTLAADMGMATAIVQRQNLTSQEINSIFWFNLSFTTGLALLLSGLSPWVGAAYGTPAVQPLLCAVALLMPLNACCAIYSALMQKALRFADATKLAMVSSLCGGLAALAAAWAGWGDWALVIQQASVVGLNLIGQAWLTQWLPARGFALEHLRRVWDFSVDMLGFQLVNFFGRNADKLLLGTFLGADQVGAYTLAYALMVFPINNVTGILQSVLLPTMATMQDDPDRMARGYIKVCRYTAFVLFPAMVGLALVAEQAVVAVYGEKWANAGRVLSVLAWVGVFQPLDSLSGTLVLARGFTRWFFLVGVFCTATTVAAFAFGLRWGLMGVAVSYLVSQLLLALMVIPRLFRKVGVPLGDFLGALALPASLTAVMGLVVALIKASLLAVGGVASGMVLGACVVAGVLSYVAGLFWTRSAFWPEAQALRRSFSRQQPA